MKTLTSYIAAILFFSMGLPFSGLSQNCVKTAPYFEGFDSLPWSIQPDGSRQIDTCWNFPDNTDWALGYKGPGSLNGYDFESCDSSGTLLRFFSKNGGRFGRYYLFVKSFWTPPPPVDVISPAIDLSNLSNPVLYFDYHMYGEDIGKLEIAWKDSKDTSWIVVDSIVGEHQHSLVDYFKSYSVLVKSGAADTINIRFRAYSDVKDTNRIIFRNRVTIDNFEISEKDPCGIPKYTGVKNVGIDSAQVFWQSASPGNTLTEVRYGLHGFTPLPAQGKSRIATGDKMVLHNLQEGQTYRVYLRHLCGTDTGRWVQPLLIQTTCSNRPRSFPYLQTMDDWGDTLSVNDFFNYKDINVRECWENKGECIRSNQITKRIHFGRDWIAHDQFGFILRDVSGKGSFLQTNTFTNSIDTSTESILTSPFVDLKGSARPQLSYWSIFRNISKPDNDNRFFVELQKKGSSKWQKLDSIIPPIAVTNPNKWRERIVNLNAFKKEIVRVRFSFINLNFTRGKFSLDEIHFREKPGCALAGQDSLVQLCDSLGSYDLSNLLDSNAAGGTWQDINGSGALSGTLLNLGQLPQDSAFPFRYLIPKDSACSADSATYTIIRNKAGCSIGLEEYQTPGLDIFPNPAQVRLYLRPQNPGLQWGEVALYNLQGQRQKVELSQKATGARELSLAGLAPGVYFLTVELEGKKVVRKVVVE